MATVQLGEKPRLIEKLIERGRDFERYQIDERTFRVILGVPAWVKDETGKYVPYVVKTYDDHVMVKSGLVSYKIYTDRLEYFDADMTELRATERLSLVIEGETSIDLSFTRRNIVENETGVFITQNYDLSQDGLAKTGEIDVTYVQRPGEALEHIVETRGLPKGVAKKIHFIWEFPTTVDEIEISKGLQGQQKFSLDKSKITLVNLNDFENVRVTKRGKLWINEITGFNKEKLQELRASDSRIILVYSGWKDQVALNHAQNFTNSSTSQDGYVLASAPAGSPNCGAAGIGKYYTPYQVMYIYLAANNVSGYCCCPYVEWSTSGLVLQPGQQIQRVVFKYDVHSSNTIKTCDVVQLNTQPSSAAGTAAQLWGEITGNAALVPNTAAFSSAGPDQMVVLAAAPADPAAQDLTAKLPAGWWGFGIRFNAPNRTGTEHRIAIKTREAAASPKPTLEVWYS